MSRTVFRLYVAGETPRSLAAIENLRRLCEDLGLREQPEIVVVDVLQHPDLADAERILATPTLVKLFPPPAQRVTGDLSDRSAVVRWLALSPAPRAPTSGDA